MGSVFGGLVNTEQQAPPAQASASVPMIGPDGSHWDIPEEKVPDAIKNGGKIGTDILGPDQQQYLIPLDRVHDAIAKGGKLIGSPLKNPAQETGAEIDQKGAEQDEVDAQSKKVSDKLGASAALAAGGGITGAAEEAPALASGAKAIAQKIYQHFLKFMGAGEEAAGGAEEAEQAAGAGKATAEAGETAGAAKPSAGEPSTSQPSAEDAPAEKTAKPVKRVKPLHLPENVTADDVRQLVAEKLKATGATTATAKDYEDALEEIEQSKQDADFGTNKKEAAGQQHSGPRKYKVLKDGRWTEVEAKDGNVSGEGAKQIKEPEQQVAKRGENKGRVKTYKVWRDGKYVEVPKYK